MSNSTAAAKRHMSFLHEVGISLVGALPPTYDDPLEVHHVRINDHVFGKLPTQSRPDWMFCVPLLKSQHVSGHDAEKTFWDNNGFNHMGLKTGPNAAALILTGFSVIGDPELARGWIKSLNNPSFAS